PPLPRATTPQDPTEPDLSAPKQRKNVKIDEGRALQIQRALKQRGFYNGELTGVYDKDTIEAMRRFQINQDIPATGYPTAHALKRRGWASRKEKGKREWGRGSGKNTPSQFSYPPSPPPYPPFPIPSLHAKKPPYLVSVL